MGSVRGLASPAAWWGCVPQLVTLQQEAACSSAVSLGAEWLCLDGCCLLETCWFGVLPALASWPHAVFLGNEVPLLPALVLVRGRVVAALPHLGSFFCLAQNSMAALDTSWGVPWLWSALIKPWPPRYCDAFFYLGWRGRHKEYGHKDATCSCKSLGGERGFATLSFCLRVCD